MKHKITRAFLALALGTMGTTIQAATYNNDLLVGFTKTTGNDLIYDLGAESSLTNGKTWNLSSLLTAGTFTLSTVKWGVVGDQNGTPKVAFTTVQNPPLIPGNTKWGQLNTATTSIYSSFTTAGAGQSATIAATGGLMSQNSWYSQMENASLTTQYQFAYANPDVTGLTTVNLNQVLADGSAPTVVGTFSLGSNGVLTFNTVSSAPPVPQILSIKRTNSVSTINFSTASGSFVYTLYFTNSSGLKAPVTNWPASPTTIIGNGSPESLTDTSSTSNRFYRIGVH